jgi:hypothetical protein
MREGSVAGRVGPFKLHLHLGVRVAVLLWPHSRSSHHLPRPRSPCSQSAGVAGAVGAAPRSAGSWSACGPERCPPAAGTRWQRPWRCTPGRYQGSRRQGTYAARAWADRRGTGNAPTPHLEATPCCCPGLSRSWGYPTPSFRGVFDPARSSGGCLRASSTQPRRTWWWAWYAPGLRAPSRVTRCRVLRGARGDSTCASPHDTRNTHQSPSTSGQDLPFFSPRGLRGVTRSWLSAHTDQNKHAVDGSGHWPIYQVRRLPTRTHAHAHAPTHAHMHTRTYTYTHTYPYMYTHAHAHAHMHTCTHAHMHICTHAHMHTRTHAHMHTCTHAHMHPHTPRCPATGRTVCPAPCRLPRCPAHCIVPLCVPQGVLYVWDSTMPEAATTVVCPGSHRDTWEDVMADPFAEHIGHHYV